MSKTVRKEKGPQRQERRIFEGRKAEIEEFKRRRKSYRRAPVWQIVGVGGIGKSALLKKLGEVARDEYVPVAILNTDRGLRSEVEALQQIAEQLGEAKFRKTRAQIANYIQLVQGVRPRKRAVLEGIVELGGTLAAEALGAPLAAVGFGTASALHKRRGEVGAPAFIEDIHERLLRAFAKDLKTYSRGRNSPALFFIDTYEEIVGTPLDGFFRRMAGTLKNSFFVFAGWHALGWEKLPGEEGRKWRRRKSFQPTRLDSLSPEDAKAYLRRRRIRAGVRDRIIDYTQCFPLFLEMAADLAQGAQKAAERLTPDDFPSGEFDDKMVAKFLFERILGRIGADSQEKDFVCTLGLCRWYDTRLAKQLAPGGPGTAYGLLSRLNSYHFVISLGTGRFAFHEAVRQAADRSFDWSCRPEQRLESHEKVIAHHEKRAEEGEKDSLLEVCYHRFRLDPEGGTEFWSDTAQDLTNSLQMLQHYQLVTDFLTYAPGEASGEARGKVLGSMANGLTSVTLGNISSNLMMAIGLQGEAVEVFERGDFPAGWAKTQNNLGHTYLLLPTGDRAQNVEKAIACHRKALKVFTRAAYPVDWARTQNSLATAYAQLRTGDRAENLRNAIARYRRALRVLPGQDQPVYWAMTHLNLATAYAQLRSGDRAENLAKAIKACQECLKVYTREKFPIEWATTQNNLGIAYSDLPTGDRGENLKKAIPCYEAALEVYTREEFPVDWAMVQNNLGTAYAELRTGDPEENLTKAFVCFGEALKVRTREDFPVEWAMTQNNLGNAYLDLPTGDRGENLRKAIASYEKALKVYTREEFPVQWARTQNNLGIAYAQLPTGDRGENVKKAIGCFDGALEIWTESAFPEKHNGAVGNRALAVAELKAL